MQRSAVLTISFGLVALAAVDTAQTPDVALCDGMATQIRESAAIAAGSKSSPLSLLSSGDRPYIELPSKPELSVTADRTQFATLFRQEFQPSDALTNALNQFSGNVLEVFSVPGSDLHMIEALGGTATCANYLFFWTPRSGQSEPLPALPRKGVRDGDNLICEGFGDDGHLARVAGVDAFVEMMQSATDNDYDFRVVPLQQGKWGPACEVKTDFRSEYNVSKVFVLTGGPVSEMALRDVAAQIVELHAAAKDPKSFSFGPPVPERETEDVRTMIHLAASLQRGPLAVPAFGREKELTAFQGSLQFVDDYPLVLGGKTYLMAIGHGAIGWRVSSDWGLILYTLQDAKLQPVGAAIVGQSQGALEGVRVSEWKLRGVAQ
jgi:hypothetical protein